LALGLIIVAKSIIFVSKEDIVDADSIIISTSQLVRCTCSDIPLASKIIVQSLKYIILPNNIVKISHTGIVGT